MGAIVSIITPLFNREELVKETYTAIAGQSMKDWEWLVVDDGSTDGGPKYVLELAKKDPRIQYLTRVDGQKGPSRCRNIGAKAANGTYLFFLDSDDLIAVTCLQNRVAHLRQFPDLDFAVFTQASFEKNPSSENAIFNKFFDNKREYLNAFIADQHPWQTSGPLWKKESFISTGGFREDYAIMEDPELHIRAIMQGLTFEVVIEEPDFFYRQAPKTAEQEIRFWEASIRGRIVFYKDLQKMLEKEGQWHTHKIEVRKGLLSFFKTFFLNRSHLYPIEFEEFILWIKNHRILPFWKVATIWAYYIINKNQFLKKLPFIKGLFFKAVA